ncbi:MAG: GlmU family protein [Bacteroidota bacterium]|nr:GlmU family protein [Bacteroidota bacterium]
MNYILFDDSRKDLLPFTFVRPVANIRIGILTIKEKWEKYLNTSVSYLTERYLIKKFPLKVEPQNILINGSICPDRNLTERIKSLKQNQILRKDKTIIAIYTEEGKIDSLHFNNFTNISNFEHIEYNGNYLKINHVWDIFESNGQAINSDFEILTKGRKSSPISDTNKIIGTNIFVEEGAKIECAILNSNTGPIYIGKDAEIMEGSLVRGPFALCDHSTLKLGAKIYGPTTIGPYSKVGGEVNNSVIFGYSNKAHDGFLGNSVIGEWCNIGADTNNSNLKNDYSTVKLWNYNQVKFVNTNLQFCGLMMGDHSKCGINTMFNTGTVVGISCNIYGTGFPRHFIPSFSWGSAIGGFETYDINKAIKTAENVYLRRELEFTETDREIFNYVYNLTYIYRY